MPEFIKREFQNHPLGTVLVCLTCLSVFFGGVTFVYSQGGKDQNIMRDISDIAKEVKTHTANLDIHPSYKDLSKDFVTRPEIERIDKQLKEMQDSQIRQESLSIEILKRLPQR